MNISIEHLEQILKEHYSKYPDILYHNIVANIIKDFDDKFGDNYCLNLIVEYCSNCNKIKHICCLDCSLMVMIDKSEV